MHLREHCHWMVADLFPVTLCVYHGLLYIYPDRNRIMTTVSIFNIQSTVTDHLIGIVTGNSYIMLEPNLIWLIECFLNLKLNTFGVLGWRHSHLLYWTELFRIHNRNNCMYCEVIKCIWYKLKFMVRYLHLDCSVEDSNTH